MIIIMIHLYGCTNISIPIIQNALDDFFLFYFSSSAVGWASNVVYNNQTLLTSV